MKLLILITLTTVLVSCSAPQQSVIKPEVVTVTKEIKVEVPVEVARIPPDALLQPYKPNELPVFVAVTNKDASCALTPEGEQQLRKLIYELNQRDKAWRTWATTKDK